MLRLYSKGCEHAIQVLSHLTPEERSKTFSVKEVCERVHLPEWSTRKAFQQLVHKGILKASQGPSGGYQFKGNPSKISLLQIIQAVDGEDALKGCVMGFSKCQKKHPCSFHPVWTEIRSTVMTALKLTFLNHLFDCKRNF
jgi:Rrf2 family protein